MVILDGPLFEQGARGLVWPFLGQRYQRPLPKRIFWVVRKLLYSATTFAKGGNQSRVIGCSVIEIARELGSKRNTVQRLLPKRKPLASMSLPQLYS